MHSPERFLTAFILVVLSLTFLGCGSSALRVHYVPDNGYEHTLNYQFQAQVHTDAAGQCRKLVVRVRPLNKVYWRDPPPDRLQLYDDDCLSPVRFERVHYLAPDGLVRLNGIEVSYFFSENFRLEDELIGWLWRSGII